MQRSQASSGSEGSVDEKKRKRMLSNRESARRSRMRKQRHLEELVKESGHLADDSRRKSTEVADLETKYALIATENDRLRAELWTLTARLSKLNQLLGAVESFSGVPIEKEEIPESLVKSWHLPFASHRPIAASGSSAHMQ